MKILCVFRYILRKIAKGFRENSWMFLFSAIVFLVVWGLVELSKIIFNSESMLICILILLFSTYAMIRGVKELIDEALENCN